MRSPEKRAVDSTQLLRMLEKQLNCPTSLCEQATKTLSDRAITIRSGGQVRLFILPPTPIKTKTVFFASSRLGRSLDDKGSWFDAIRSAAMRLADGEHSLLTAAGITAEKYIRRIAQLWRFRLLELKPFPAKLDEHTLNVTFAKTDIIHFGHAIDITSGEPIAQRPAIDFPLTEFADLMIVLRVSSKGTVRKATIDRLNKRGSSAFPSTRVLIDPSLTRPKVSDELLKLGATGWWLYQDQPAEETLGIGVEPKAILSRQQTLPNSKNLSDLDHLNVTQHFPNIREMDTRDYLSHWTRKQAGQWPDQTEEDYLDDLIFRDKRGEHTSLNALCRIAASMKILGSSTLSKSKQPVVCWTEVPTETFPERRIFRPHISRWDFELFGIAARKDIVVQRGGQPVIYGSQETWKGLTATEQPFFQLSTSADGKIDWTLEREWRTLGHFDLRQLGVDDAFLFVRSSVEAMKLAPLSRWPIAVFE